MKIIDFRGFEIHQPTSGGKAGTGHNKTSTIQVRLNNSIRKQFRYKVTDTESLRAALKKAKQFCLSNCFCG